MRILGITTRNGNNTIIRCLEKMLYDNVLHTVHLNFIHECHEQIKQLCTALKKNTSLEELDLGYTVMSSNISEYLIDMLKNNIGIKKITIRYPIDQKIRDKINHLLSKEQKQKRIILYNKCKTKKSAATNMNI